MTDQADLLSQFSNTLVARTEAAKSAVVAIRLAHRGHLTGMVWQPDVVVTSEKIEKTGLARILADMKEGASFIFHHAALLFVIVALAAGMFVMGCFGPLIAIFVRDTLRASTNVFGLASAVGPLLGGYFTDHGTVSIAGHTVEGWRWVFYLNLPMGLIAATTSQIAQAPTHVTGAILIGVDLGPNL